jgi:hypothetical protein
MGDSCDDTSEALELLEREQILGDRACDRLLGVEVQQLRLNEDSLSWIWNNVDCFVRKCRSNKSLDELSLNPYALSGYDDSDNVIWDKIGRAIGNLQALDRILISTDYYQEDDDNEDDDDVPVPDWGLVARILSHVRQDITLAVNTTDVSRWSAEDIRSFASAIHGHPTIRRFVSDSMSPFQASDSLYSALATLPALEEISLSNNTQQEQPENESTMAHHQSLTDLLRVPTLWLVRFDCFYFTRALCQATANTLMEGTALGDLEFIGCSFGDVDQCAAILAKAFSRDKSVRNMTWSAL